MTIREIAKIAKVSPATVSNVINNKPGVSYETREKVLAVLKQYNYPIKSKLKNGKILILKYMSHGKAVEENRQFMSSLIDNVQVEAIKFGFEITIMNINNSNVKEAIKNINKDKLDGVLFIGTEYRSGIDTFLKKIEVPTVVIDNSMQYDSIDTVLMDNTKIINDIVTFLYNSGYRKIGYIKSNIGIDNLDERYSSFEDNIERYNLEKLAPIEVDPTLMGSYKNLKENIDKIDISKYEVFVCDLDAIALGVMRVFLEEGLNIPNDISIVGVDDIPYSSISIPFLTTAGIGKRTIAYHAINLLKKRINNEEYPPVSIKVSGELKVRDSTKFFDK